MSDTERNEDVFIQIARIKQMSFSINEEAAKDIGGMSKLGIAYKLDHNLEREWVNLTMKISLTFSDDNNAFIQAEVQNIFAIKDLKRFIGENDQLVLPRGIFITIISLSLSHTRSIMAINVAGTSFNDYLIPLLDGEEVAKNFIEAKANA